MRILGAVALLSFGMVLAGCKSVPDLTQDQALALIQAKYDATPAVGANITVNDLGMRQGITAKYWNRTTIYPNKFWADFTLTPDGKKVITLPKGGDVIQWRPDSLTDTNYSVVVVTVAANHLKARSLGTVQDEALAGVSTAKGASFTEAIDLTGVPDALQEIAHNPGNQLAHEASGGFRFGWWGLEAAID